MKKGHRVVLVILAVCFMAVTAGAVHHAVKIATKEGLGNYLTDTEGMTLYWFMNDSPEKSTCTGSCLDNWPIYYRETVAPPGTLKAADFGTMTREDGKKQTTFRSYPLYYWVGDKKAGDTNGDGVRDVWFVIDPANFPPEEFRPEEE